MKALEDKKDDKRKGKGVPRRKVKGFSHQDYKRVFFTEHEVTTNCRRMQSVKHVVYNVELSKVALSLVDDKRAWLSHNYSLPYGHFRVPYYNVIRPPNIVDPNEPPSRSVQQLHDQIFSPTKRPRLQYRFLGSEITRNGW